MLSKGTKENKNKIQKGKFRFDYDMKMYVSIDERLFHPGQITQKQLEQSIKEDLTSRFEELIKIPKAQS